ncbi:MAG: hypothetical protein ACE14T_11435 [Syntrophales bacterium]
MADSLIVRHMVKYYPYLDIQLDNKYPYLKWIENFHLKESISREEMMDCTPEIRQFRLGQSDKGFGLKTFLQTPRRSVSKRGTPPFAVVHILDEKEKPNLNIFQGPYSQR